MRRIFVVGSLNMDLVGCAPRIPAVGETIIGRRFFQSPGGKGANQAYAAATLGGLVTMIGCVGEDANGLALREQLDSVGCDTRYLQTSTEPTGVALITVSDQGENVIVVIGGANNTLSPVMVRNALTDASIGAGDLLLLQLETPLTTVAAAARTAKMNGATVILDPAPVLPDFPIELFANVDILTPNESEAALLAGASPLNDLSLGEAETIARNLQRLGSRTVIVKLGARGCLLVDVAQAAAIKAPVVAAIDSTAAGDVFNAALAVALGEGASLQSACRFAVEASALSVTRRGAQPSAPSRSEVAAALGQMRSS